MPKVPVYNMEGAQVGEIELRDDIFGAPVNTAVLYEVALMYQANQRKGTHDTKTRGEVAGGGRKPWRQKGTGRARHGSIRSPLWRKGGTVFGPHPRDYSYSVPKKVRRVALKSALSDKVNENNLIVVDSLTFAAPKTKDMVKVLDNLKVEGKALIVTASHDEVVEKSARNIPGVSVMTAPSLNALSLLNHDKLIMTRDAVLKVEEVF